MGDIANLQQGFGVGTPGVQGGFDALLDPSAGPRIDPNTLPLAPKVTLTQLETTPAYRALNYQEQQMARDIYYKENIANLRGLYGDPDAQDLAYKQIVLNRAPVTQTSDPLIKQWVDTANRLKINPNDPEALATARSHVLQEELIKNWGIVGWGLQKLANVGYKVFKNIDMETDNPVIKNDRAKAFSYLHDVSTQTQGFRTFGMDVLGAGAIFGGALSDVFLARGLGGAMLKGTSFLANSAIPGSRLAGAFSKMDALVNDGAAAKILSQWKDTSAFKYFFGRVGLGAGSVAYDASAMTGSYYANQQLAESIFGDVVPDEQKKSLLQVFGENALGDIAFRGLANFVYKPIKATIMAKRALKQADAGATPEDQTKAIFAANDIPNDVLATYPPEVRDNIVRFRNQEWAKAVREGRPIDLEPGSDALNELLAQRAGFLMSKNGKGYEVFAPDASGKQVSLGTFANSNDATDGILKHLNARETVGDGRAAISPDAAITVQEIFTHKALPEQVSTALAADLQPNIYGKLDDQAIAQVAKSTGKTPIAVSEDNYLKLKHEKTMTEESIFYPSTVTKPETIQKLGESFATNVENAGVKNLPEFSQFSTNFKKAQVHESEKYSQTWLVNTAKTYNFRVVNHENGAVDLLDPQGSPLSFPSAKHAASWLNYTKLQDGSLMNDLPNFYRQEMGLYTDAKLDPNSGSYLVNLRTINADGSPGGVVASTTAPSMEQGWNQIWQARPDLLPKMPVQSAPSFHLLDSGDIQFDGATSVGSFQTLTNQSKQFWDNLSSRSQKLYSKMNNDLSFQPETKMYKVRVNDYDIEKTFASPQEAAKFASESHRNWDDMVSFARVKGLDVQFQNGRYHIYNYTDGSPAVARNFEEAIAYIKNQPALKAAQGEVIQELLLRKDLFNLPELQEYLGPLSDVKNIHFTSADIDNAVRTKTIRDDYVPGGITTMTPEAINKISRAAKDTGPTEMYNLLDRASYRARGGYQKSDAALQSILRGTNKYEKKALLDLMRTPEAEWPKALEELKKHYPIHLKNIDSAESIQKMKEISTQLRGFLTEHGKLFGVDPFRMLTDYIPRIQGYLKADIAKKAGSVPEQTALDYLHERWAGGIPDDLKFFAENMRMRDLSDFANSADIDNVINGYLQGGYRKTYMNEALNQSKQIYGRLVGEKKINQDQAHYMADWMNNVAHGNKMDELGKRAAAQWEQWHTDFTKTEKKIRAAILKRIPEGPRQRLSESWEVRDVQSAYRDMGDFMRASVTASTQAFRPILPLRNMQGVHTVLAPIIGPEWVDAAIAKMGKTGELKNLTKQIIEDRNNGIFMETATPFGEAPTSQGFLGKFNEQGMKWYRDSDLMTRVVANGAVNLRWENALKSLGGELHAGNLQEFTKRSGINMLPPEEQKVILGSIQANGLNAAKGDFQRAIQNLSMGTYRSWDNPAGARSFFGKMAYQYGHYSMNYLRMIKQFATHPDPGVRFEFFMNLAIKSISYWAISEKIYGISGQQYLPWGQMFFAGGPFLETFSAISDGIQAVAQHGPAILDPKSLNAHEAQALKAIPDKIAGSFLPLYTPLKKIFVNAEKALSKQDYYEAAVQAIGLPYIGWHP